MLRLGFQLGLDVQVKVDSLVSHHLDQLSWWDKIDDTAVHSNAFDFIEEQ